MMIKNNYILIQTVIPLILIIHSPLNAQETLTIPVTTFVIICLFITVLVFFLVYLLTKKFRQEIKQKKQLEKKLKASIYDFKMLVNSTLEAIFIFDQHGYCIEANNKAIQMFQFHHPNDILGKHALRLINKKSRETIMKKLETSQKEPYETDLIRQDKTTFPGLIKNVNSKRGNKSIRIISVIDLSNLKEKERILLEQSKMALMGEMMSEIAHQWRQPLNSIAALNLKVETLLDFNHSITKNDYSPISTHLKKELHYLSQTIDDFKNFFIPNTKKTEFNLAQAIHDVHQMLQSHLKSYDIHVILETKNVLTYGYENEFKQVIINILTNSKDALIHQTQYKRYIHIKMISENNKSIILIEDNGGGIKKDIMKKIFNPYFTTKFKSKGTGIGLYMSKMIIENSMSGKLFIENSKVGVICKILL